LDYLVNTRVANLLIFHTKLSVKKTDQRNINSFVIKTTAAEEAALNIQVARYVYSSNSPFTCVENKEFLKLIEMLRPGYKPPNRHQIGDNLLHNVFETEKNVCRKKLHNQIVCMSFDGISNIHNEPIISACITTEKGHIYLIDSFDTSGNSHFSEYLMNIVETAIKNIEETFGCIVGSVITDHICSTIGAANMVHMRDLMKKTIFHNVNLFYTHVKFTCKRFRNSWSNCSRH